MAKIITTGWAETGRVLAAMPAALDAASRGAVVQSAALIEARAKRNFIGSHAKGQPHVGGDKPNVVTGMLRRSILTQGPTPLGAGVWMARVGPTAIYGRRVELGYSGGAGGRGHQRTRPFPYLRPAAEGATWQLRNIALAHWARVFE